MSTETADWPYDAIQDDPLTAVRIPVVGNAWPRWCYLVAFDLDQIDHPDTVHRPDEREARMLRSFLDEYLQRWYSPAWVRKMSARPFDIDSGANTLIFRKWGVEDWGYRRDSWRYGPEFWPGAPWYREQYGEGPGREAHSLERVMDHVHTVGDEPMPHWLEWKAAHPDVFGGAR